LYNIFTSDVPTSSFCKTATFADDTAIYSSIQTPHLIQDELQNHLNSIFDYCKDWKIKTNATKTQAIYFSRCTKNVSQTSIVLDGNSIPWSKEVKYLGVHLDTRLTFAIQKSQSQLKKLVWLLECSIRFSTEGRNYVSKTNYYFISCASGQFFATASKLGSAVRNIIEEKFK
jgi:Reverse transcriptase (RNA-dependent DNA polymerase)